MQIIPIFDSDAIRLAAKIATIPADADDLAAVVDILMGRHERAAELLREVMPGSLPDKMKATHCLYLAFDHVPTRDEQPDCSGVDAVMAWIVNKLDPAMPDGW